MPDDIDQAQAVEELLRVNAIATRRNVLTPRGACYNCEDPTEAVFCCVDCREDYETRARVLAISGR